MSDAKPWEAVADTRSIRGVRVWRVIWSRPVEGGRESHDSAMPDEATARRCAASDDLLAACEALLSVVDRLPNGHSEQRVTSANAANAAIAKARGQA